MYAQATLKRNIISHNVTHRIVNRGVQKCTCAGASLRSKKYVPLNCINLDTATEPSCGAGNFIYAISQRMDELGISAKEKLNKILGIELYDGEAEKARAYGATIETSDFFGYYKDNIRGKKTFDVVLGNPPFIWYQNFEEKYRNLAFELSDEIGIKLNRLTNIWIPFLILSTECLKENGKLGMVIPAELFQVDYAAATRKYLTEKFEHFTIITFKKVLFEGTQEEVVILLGEKKSNKKGIEVVELEDASELISKKNRFRCYRNKRT